MPAVSSRLRVPTAFDSKAISDSEEREKAELMEAEFFGAAADAEFDAEDDDESERMPAIFSRLRESNVSKEYLEEREKAELMEAEFFGAVADAEFDAEDDD